MTCDRNRYNFSIEIIIGDKIDLRIERGPSQHETIKVDTKIE